MASKKKKDLDKIPLADELKIETYPRISQKAVFDRLDLVIKLFKKIKSCEKLASVLGDSLSSWF